MIDRVQEARSLGIQRKSREMLVTDLRPDGVVKKRREGKTRTKRMINTVQCMCAWPQEGSHVIPIEPCNRTPSHLWARGEGDASSCIPGRDGCYSSNAAARDASELMPVQKS